MIVIHSEVPRDGPAIEALLDEAFCPRRHAKTAERLREGREPADGLSLVALDGRRVVGTVRLWHVAAGDRPALLLGPVAVADGRRGQGIGKKLVETALERALMRGHEAVILVGDAPYYGRFDFRRDLTLGLALPGPVDPDRFLGLELVPGALAGATGLVQATGEPAVAEDRPAFVDMDRPRPAFGM